ncbi:glycosyltransferase [Mucilaginibacter sp.]|uniref:glycosyltransferase n=1 Tax=Mucilaginibacter sp. TaxID=1882438 RepID=UPI00261113C7|nr:glycosyltransferase [Mucilaginibacter sp.]MDB4919110.1 hypothetical protein [Mucilaginibacter sp.]
MAFLSIIVPVYNKVNYLDGCIESILLQTFRDFELILVNDGSTDGSSLRCNYYAAIDHRVILIEQENAGVSAARNTGLQSASGQYIGFIDADDTIEPDMYELLIENAQKFDADICACRMKVIFDYKISCPAESSIPIEFNHSEALSACLKGDLERSANNKLYKAELARQIKFEGYINEDILYTCKAFLGANKTVLLNLAKYNYLVRADSASMSKFNPKYMEIIDVSGKMVDLVSKKDTNSIAEAKSFDVMANISLLNLLLLAGKNSYPSQYTRVVDTLLRYKYFINNSELVKKKHKYAFKLFSLSPLFYAKLMYLYCTITKSEAVKRT